MSEDPFRIWKQAYARLAPSRRKVLEEEFEKHDTRARAMSAMAQARGQEMELHEWIQFRIEFVGEQMAAQHGLSPEEFLGLALHMHMYKLGEGEPNAKAASGSSSGCSLLVLSLCLASGAISPYFS